MDSNTPMIAFDLDVVSSSGPSKDHDSISLLWRPEKPHVVLISITDWVSGAGVDLSISEAIKFKETLDKAITAMALA